MGVRVPQPGLRPLVERLDDPRARVELVCTRCGRQRRREIFRVVAWLKRTGVRRLDWVAAPDIERYIAGYRCADCGGRKWSAAVVILPELLPPDR